MQLLKDRILTDGVVKEGNILKVDSFLNHQMDIDLINAIGKEFKKRFDHCPITKILTIEASGIGIACIAAQYFHVPVVFAKKAQSVNLDGEMYTTKVESFTHKKVSCKRLRTSWPDRHREEIRCNSGRCRNRYRKRLPVRRTDHP